MTQRARQDPRTPRTSGVRSSSGTIYCAVGLVVMAVLLSTARGAVADGSDTRTSIKRPAINGTFVDALSGEGAFSGNIALGHFEQRRTSLVVVATLSGVLSESTGRVIGRVDQEVVLPVAIVNATCQLLHLDVGPVALDLLGIRVHLERDALGITTRDGPSRNLLCSTASFFASRPAVDAAAARLNTVLDVLAPSR